MSRVCLVSSWCCACAAIALFVVTISVTPESVFADGGSDDVEVCEEQCEMQCALDPNYQACFDACVEECTKGVFSCYDDCKTNDCTLNSGCVVSKYDNCKQKNVYCQEQCKCYNRNFDPMLPPDCICTKK